MYATYHCVNTEDTNQKYGLKKDILQRNKCYIPVYDNMTVDIYKTSLYMMVLFKDYCLPRNKNHKSTWVFAGSTLFSQYFNYSIIIRQ